MNLAQSISLYGGGPGSGCNPAAGKCGRPITSKMYREMRKYLRTRGIKIPRGVGGFDIVKAYDAHRRAASLRKATKTIQQALTQKHKARVKQAMKEGKFGKKIGTTTPGITKSGGKLHIDVQPVWKGSVKTQYTTTGGHQVTELKTPKLYQKSGKSWVGKPSQFKGQFLKDLPLFQRSTYSNATEKNSWWIHQATPDKAVSLEVHRNLGEKRVNVIERTLGQHNAIIQHREVTFKNVGRAMGFMNRRYGITFKIK
jgi:hypothetical protein